MRRCEKSGSQACFYTSLWMTSADAVGLAPPSELQAGGSILVCKTYRQSPTAATMKSPLLFFQRRTPSEAGGYGCPTCILVYESRSGAVRLRNWSSTTRHDGNRLPLTSSPGPRYCDTRPCCRGPAGGSAVGQDLQPYGPAWPWAIRCCRESACHCDAR